MHDVSVGVPLAAFGKPQRAVKPDRRYLRIKEYFFHPSGACIINQRLHYRPADALAATVLSHRDPADLTWMMRVAIDDPAGADGGAVVVCNIVHGVVEEGIVLIKLILPRIPLLVAKYGYADASRILKILFIYTLYFDHFQPLPPAPIFIYCNTRVSASQPEKIIMETDHYNEYLTFST